MENSSFCSLDQLDAQASSRWTEAYIALNIDPTKAFRLSLVRRSHDVAIC